MGRIHRKVVHKYRTRADCYLQDLKESKMETLFNLKIRIQLENSRIKTYTEETQTEIKQNTETIENLRSSIQVAREALAYPNRKYDILMRKALKDYHEGSSIFREKEPRDVHDIVDNKTRDMINKLNKVRYLRIKKMKQLEELLILYQDEARDSAYLDLEGPAGDTRVLALENHIGETGKKNSEVQRLNTLYRRIKEQLVLENMNNDKAINAANLLLQHHQDELEKCRQACEDAIARKKRADREAWQMDSEIHAQRKIRYQTEYDFRRERDEQTQELNDLWFKIQAYFASQDGYMPMMGRAMSCLSRSHLNESGDELSLLETKEQFEERFAILGSVMGCKHYTDVLEGFDQQMSKFQHLSSLIKQLEQTKYDSLQELADLTNVQASQTFRPSTEQEQQLEATADDSRQAQQHWREQRWSLLAAGSRTTHTLSQLRDVLQYLVDVLAAAELVEPPPRHDGRHTELHLLGTLAAATAGVQQLMQVVGNVDVDEMHQSAVDANFVMTKSESRVRPLRVKIDRPLRQGSTKYVESDDTGDDSKVPSRAAIKRQAQILLQAKAKRQGPRRSSYQPSQFF